MKQPIKPADVITVDDHQTLFWVHDICTEDDLGEDFNEALKAVASKEFEQQEHWINAIAHCPFLSPEHVWKTGNLKIAIGFIPAEPWIDGDVF